MPSGKKRKRHKMSTHKRKKRLRKNRHKKNKQRQATTLKREVGNDAPVFFACMQELNASPPEIWYSI